MFVLLELSANLVNVESFVSEGEDFRWYVKVSTILINPTKGKYYYI